MSDILSFVTGSPDVDPDYIDNTDIIWPKLLAAITKVVREDGIRNDAILSGQSEKSVTVNASENIYYDVSEFFYWYFEGDDPRNEFMAGMKKGRVGNPSLRAAIIPMVLHNLADMRESDQIPAGLDSEGLVDIVTDNLVSYILNWQDWYYDRKLDEDLEEHFYQKGLYQEIYVDGDYGDLTNLGSYLDSDVDDPEGFG